MRLVVALVNCRNDEKKLSKEEYLYLENRGFHQTWTNELFDEYVSSDEHQDAIKVTDVIKNIAEGKLC